jgi:alginate O-acetyltransferase complex protein AlgJ
MQTAITGWLKGGNEDAYCGRDGWLFYRRDVDSLTGPGFLDPRVLKRRAAAGSELKAPPQPDPVRAIVEFRDQLAARGIALVVMPAPVKPTIHPEHHTARYAAHAGAVQNPSFEAFKARLAAEHVAVFDPAPRLAATKAAAPATPLYLKTDTHWTPEAMDAVAWALADAVRRAANLPPAIEGRFKVVEQVVTNRGDVAMMLKLPAGQTAFPPETARIRQVLDGNRFWRPDPKAEVLFLGDSFANIYSLEPMGWGESAGLAEHLSLALGLPVDAITRNDAGSYATREMLAKELQRGNDRLAGKKLVIWEFAARELACGDWKILPLALGEKREAGLYAPPAGRTVAVRGVVRAASQAPRPGTVPYKDHIVMLDLDELESSEDAAAGGREAVVFVWSMRDNTLTPGARHRAGDTVQLRLRRWADVAPQYEAINRSELEADNLLLAEPCWGEE